MDEAKRRELEARRSGQRERNSASRREGKIARRLASCAVPHELTDEGIWTPDYLPVTATRIYWEGAPDPARWTYCETYKARVDTIRGMVEEVAKPGDLLRFSYDSGFESDFTILAGDALQRPVLSILLASRRTIWITSFPQQWLIEWGEYHTARLAKPPPGFGEQQAAREAAYLAPLTDLLRARGIVSITTSALNPNGPRPPAVALELRRESWSNLRRSLSEGIDKRAGGPLSAMLALRKVLEPFLIQRTAPDGAIVVDLLARDAPRLQLPRQGLIDCLPGLYRLLHRSPADTADAPIATPKLWLYANGGDWLLEIDNSGSHITVRATG